MPSAKSLIGERVFSTFRDECLSAHNEYRSPHGAQPLEISTQLCQSAQKWAEHLAQTGNLEYDTASPHGQNVGMKPAGGKTPLSGRALCGVWYGEKGKYDFAKKGHQDGTAHFTQVVWKDSREFGLGMAKDAEGNVIVVVNYSPPGNVLGKFPANVLSDSERKPSVPGGNKATKGKPAKDQKGRKPSQNASDDEDDTDWTAEKVKEAEAKFVEELIERQNYYRAKHGCDPVTLDPGKLTEHAQMWAETMAKDRQLKHSGNHEYGENIGSKYSKRGRPTKAAEVVDMWYDEINHYNFDQGGHQEGTGHFTQLVWKSAREVGVGWAKDDTRTTTYVTANYLPAGNKLDEFAENVVPPL
ncbi:GLIPR2 [Branchiostoma lanceolatum]|uniref:GLIPR2 protein n=1 Tax=Branchiostoma lanceolatum TaxID=7740 RepID=A0A8K0EZ56_BRALA|nr:GLIPR2 [Branchiostoma lanceolatum]